MALHLDGQGALQYVDEERNRVHVTAGLTTGGDLAQHRRELVVALGEADRLVSGGKTSVGLGGSFVNVV